MGCRPAHHRYQHPPQGAPAHPKRLGVWASTAICGNDITSSCLYVSALCAAQAGRYAPIALGMVALDRRPGDQGVLYFAKGDDPAEINRAALYVLENEETRRMIVVHVYPPGGEIPPKLAGHLRGIDHLYPQLRIDLLAVEGEFGPALIEALSERLKIPRNYMFIGTPGDYLPHRTESLGGVRSDPLRARQPRSSRRASPCQQTSPGACAPQLDRRLGG